MPKKNTTMEMDLRTAEEKKNNRKKSFSQALTNKNIKHTLNVYKIEPNNMRIKKKYSLAKSKIQTHKNIISEENQYF